MSGSTQRGGSRRGRRRQPSGVGNRLGDGPCTRTAGHRPRCRAAWRRARGAGRSGRRTAEDRVRPAAAMRRPMSRPSCSRPGQRRWRGRSRAAGSARSPRARSGPTARPTRRPPRERPPRPGRVRRAAAGARPRAQDRRRPARAEPPTARARSRTDRRRPRWRGARSRTARRRRTSAASTALPPSRSTSRAWSVASGWLLGHHRVRRDGGRTRRRQGERH